MTATAITSDFEYTVPIAKSRSRNARRSAIVATIWLTPASVASTQKRGETSGRSLGRAANHTAPNASAKGAP